MSDTKTEKCQFCGAEMWAYVNDMAVFKCGQEMGMRSEGCLENEIANLNRDLTAARERIKRLEEAGDRAILKSYLPDRLAVWTAAKEAKP